MAQDVCYWRLVFFHITIKPQTFHASVGKIQLSSFCFSVRILRRYIFSYLLFYFLNLAQNKFSVNFSSFCWQVSIFTLLHFMFQLSDSAFQNQTFQVSFGKFQLSRFCFSVSKFFSFQCQISTFHTSIYTLSAEINVCLSMFYLRNFCKSPVTSCY